MVNKHDVALALVGLRVFGELFDRRGIDIIDQARDACPNLGVDDVITAFTRLSKVLALMEALDEMPEEARDAFLRQMTGQPVRAGGERKTRTMTDDNGDKSTWEEI